MFEPTENTAQDTNAAENIADNTADDFLEGFCGEETQAMPQDTNAAEPQTQETAPESQPEEQDTNAEGEQEGSPEEGESEPAEQTIEITFLGDKRQMPLSEAAPLIQKGMNYDHLQERVTRLESELKANAVPPEIEAYAKTCGMTGQALIAHFGQLARNAGIEVAASGGYMHQKAVDDWKDFMREYPDVNPKTDLPQEVWDGINAGLTPRQALIEFKARGFEAQLAAKDKEIADAVAEKDKKIAELEKALETERKNNKNAQKAVGSLATSGNGTDDDFLNAFLNA